MFEQRVVLRAPEQMSSDVSVAAWTVVARFARVDGAALAALNGRANTAGAAVFAAVLIEARDVLQGPSRSCSSCWDPKSTC